MKLEIKSEIVTWGGLALGLAGVVDGLHRGFFLPEIAVGGLVAVELVDRAIKDIDRLQEKIPQSISYMRSFKKYIPWVVGAVIAEAALVSYFTLR